MGLVLNNLGMIAMPRLPMRALLGIFYQKCGDAPNFLAQATPPGSRPGGGLCGTS